MKPLPIPRAIEALFRTARGSADPPPMTSSVLAPLIVDEDAISFLFTRRTKHLSAFAGHLSFPGGRIDPSDATPLDAALRETHEEIGLHRDQIQILGHFTELHTHFGLLVICFAGAIAPRDVPARATSPREVEEILQVPVDSLLRPGTHGIPQGGPRYVATAYESRRVGSEHAPSRTLHYWTLQNRASLEQTILWGLTAEIVSRFLHLAYDWTPPSPPKTVDELDELEP